MLADNGALHDGKAKDREKWLATWKVDARLKSGLAVGFGFLSAALVIGQCWLIARIVASMVIDKVALADITGWLILMAGVFVLRFVTDTLKRGFAFEAALAVKSRMRAALFDRIVAIGPAGLERQPSGDLTGLMTAAIDDVENYFSGYLPQKLLAALIPLLILVVVFPFDRVSFLILLITLPILPVFMVIVGKGAEKLNRRQWRRLSAMGAHFFDVVEGLTTLKQLGASRREAAIVARVSEDYRRTTMDVLRVAFLSSLVLEFFATISVAMVAVYVGFRLYYGDMLFFPGLFALLLAPEFFRPLREMGTHYHARMTALAAAEKLMRVFEIPVPEQGQGDLPPDAPLSITFESVSFFHESGGGVADISLTINDGECLAITGPSGAGKTTLTRLLLGFLKPSKGRIVISNIDLADLSQGGWLRHIGWVPQRSTAFSGTIRDNILLARPDTSPEAIAQATRAVGAQAMIESLPAGYDTPLGADGQGLSGGQMQRIVLARTVLSSPRLVILDEPTAALDRETATGLLSALRAALPGATVIVVTHDDGLARQADRIVTMEEGRITGVAGPKGEAE